MQDFVVPVLKKFDTNELASYSYGEIHAALKFITKREYGGALEATQRSLELSHRIVQDGVVVQVLRYLITLAGKIEIRITPFSIESEARRKFHDFCTTPNTVKFNSVEYPKVCGYVDYSMKMKELALAFPGANILPFSFIWAHNVNIMSSYSRYIRVGNEGKVDYGTFQACPHMYTTGGILDGIMKQVKANTSMSGYEWASYLYMYLYSYKDDLCAYLVEVLAPVPEVVETVNERKMITKPHNVTNWQLHKAPKLVTEMLPMMQKYQLMRGQNQQSRSSMTYAMYGQDFGSDMSLAENLSGLHSYCQYLKAKDKIKPDTKLMYVTNSERALMCAALVLDKYNISLHHNQISSVEGHPPSHENFWKIKEVYVYDPDTITDNGYTVNDEISLDKYKFKQESCFKAKINAYRDAAGCAFAMHIVGYEYKTLALPAPHNMIGIVVSDYEDGDYEALWNTCMLATCMRCYYFLVRVDFLKMYDYIKSNGIMKLSGYGNMPDIPFVKFTKAQKKIALNFLASHSIDVSKFQLDVNQKDMNHIEKLINQDPTRAKQYQEYVIQSQQQSIGEIRPNVFVSPGIGIDMHSMGNLSFTPKPAVPLPTIHPPDLRQFVPTPNEGFVNNSLQSDFAGFMTQFK